MNSAAVGLEAVGGGFFFVDTYHARFPAVYFFLQSSILLWAVSEAQIMAFFGIGLRSERFLCRYVFSSCGKKSASMFYFVNFWNQSVRRRRNFSFVVVVLSEIIYVDGSLSSVVVQGQSSSWSCVYVLSIVLGGRPRSECSILGRSSSRQIFLTFVQDLSTSVVENKDVLIDQP